MKVNVIKFNEALKKYNINSRNKCHHIDDDFKIVNLKCYFEKNYYNKIMEVCHNENMTLLDILNEALGMYINLNYINPDEHQKYLEKKWNEFNNKK